MSQSIGNTARVGKVFIAPELGSSDEPNKILRQGGHPGVSGDLEIVHQVKNHLGNDSLRLLQAGTLYIDDIEPMQAGSQIGAGLPFNKIRTNTLQFGDGTTQTTAATSGATPGLEMVGANSIAPAPSLVSGDLFTAGALGEVGRWKVVVPNLVFSAAATFGLFMTQVGGGQLSGTATGINYDTVPPGFLNPINVAFPGVNIPLTIDPIAAGTHSQLEIDITQKTGDYGSVAIRYCYFSDSGRFRTTTRNFQTIPPRDMAGFYIRPSAGTCQATIYTYKYSSV
mgnify:CR=1 FL=1|tara:strand:+ start:223 stop:1068 length:846 start_codon:yes stop_codon:yes gene_type:complete